MPPRSANSLKTDSSLLKILANLNQISSAINRISPGDMASNDVTLCLIVESAIRVIPGSSAVIYTYDEVMNSFESQSRVAAGIASRYPSIKDASANDFPRSQGIGIRAITQRRSAISYEEDDINIHPYHAARGVKAVACFPLIVADQAVGVLYVYLHNKREFTRLELLMLANFVNQAAIAIYHTRHLTGVRRNLARKEEELNRLHRAGMLISSRLRLEETLESILQLALEVIDAQYGIFRLLDKSGQMLITRAVAGEQMARPMVEALPLNTNSVMGWVAKNRQPVLIPDLHAEPWTNIYYPLDAELKMRSELAVPLINASGRLEGVLNLESPQVGTFSENDSHMLQMLATYAVTAIQEVRLLDALQDVARRLLSQPCPEVLNHLTSTACDLLNASASALWRLEGDELVLGASCGGYQHGKRIPLKGSLAGRAIIESKSLVADDLRKDVRFHRPDLAQSQNWARALVVPLMSGSGEQPIGAFSVYSSGDDPGRFAESEWDKKVLTCLAHYAVLAIQNEAHQEALRAAQEQHSLAETFAAIGDITSNLLHHLNNKVGTIPVRVQNMQDKCQSAIEADPYLANNLTEIEHCASEAMQSVHDNLSHLRPIRLEPVYVAARVLDAITIANLPSGIRTETEGLDHLPAVTACSQSLGFVFTNLFENASDAMQGEGLIRVKGSTYLDWVDISVSDSGPGIPPALHERIFELNYSGRTSTRPGKLGFGLWWVKTLMARLGGSVTVESDGSCGTTFRLRLPRVKEIL